MPKQETAYSTTIISTFVLFIILITAPETTSYPNYEQTGNRNTNTMTIQVPSDFKLGIFCNGDQLEDLLTHLTAGKFNQIYVNTAHWNQWYEGDDPYNVNSLVLSWQWGGDIDNVINFVSAVKAVNPNIEVFAWITSMYGVSPAAPDPTSSAKRTEIIAEVMGYVNTCGFDGVMCDPEGIVDSASDQILYWNALQLALGTKPLFTYNSAWMGTQITVNYAIMFGWNASSTEGYIATYDPLFTSNYIFDATAIGTPDLNAVLANVETILTDHNYQDGKWKGIALNGYYYVDDPYFEFTTSDWTAWNTFVSKLSFQVATPLFNPAAGTYGVTNVTISTVTSGATIYYTDNGDDPTDESTEYSTPVEVAASKTLKALGVKASYTNSAIGVASYTINNPVTPSAAAVRAYLAMLRRR